MHDGGWEEPLDVFYPSRLIPHALQGTHSIPICTFPLGRSFTTACPCPPMLSLASTARSSPANSHRCGCLVFGKMKGLLALYLAAFAVSLTTLSLNVASTLQVAWCVIPLARLARRRPAWTRAWCQRQSIPSLGPSFCSNHLEVVLDLLPTCSTDDAHSRCFLAQDPHTDTGHLAHPTHDDVRPVQHLRGELVRAGRDDLSPVSLEGARLRGTGARSGV